MLPYPAAIFCLVGFAFSENLSGSTENNLIQAARNGQTVAVNPLLVDNVALESFEEQHGPPLCWVSSNGYFEALVSKGANTEAKGPRKQKPLIQVAGYLYTALVNLLLSKDAVKGSWDTALCCAAWYGHINTVKLLLNKVPNIQAKCATEQISFIETTTNGHTALVNLLFSQSAATERKDNAGYAAVRWATSQRQNDKVELLLSKGANTKRINEMGETPLIQAAKYGHASIVNLLLPKGAAVDEVYNGNDTLPHWAVWKAHIGTVESSLPRSFNIATKNKKGGTPLIQEANQGHIRIVDMLFSKYAIMDSLHNFNATALCWAAWNGHNDFLSEVRISDFYTFLMQLEKQEKVVVIYVLLVKGAVEFLLSKGANVETKNKEGGTPLTQVIIKGYTAIANFLFSNGSNIENLHYRNDTDFSWRAFKGHLDTFFFCTEAYKDEEKGDVGKISFIQVVKSKAAALVNLLLSKGEAKESLNNFNDTPLGWAVFLNGHNNAIEFLLSKGAKP